MKCGHPEAFESAVEKVDNPPLSPQETHKLLHSRNPLFMRLSGAFPQIHAPYYYYNKKEINKLYYLYNIR